MGISMGQILLTVSLCGFSTIPSASLFLWPLGDAFRVFISFCLRMDFLLREQLEGQESHLAVLRRVLVAVNFVGFIFALSALGYKPLMTGKPLEFFILSISVLCLHLLTSIPTISYLWKGQDVMRSIRPESEDPLLAVSERPQLSGDELVLGSNESYNESNYISPFPQNVQFTGENLLADIPHLEHTSPIGTPEPALEPNSRLAIRQQQDLEYDIMLADQKSKNEPPTQHHVIEPVEVKSEAPVEPDAHDTFAVEMRIMTPIGTQVTRRFDRRATLSLVLKWVKSNLRDMNIAHDKGFRLCERFPRKVYSSSDYKRTLESLNFWREGRPAPQRSSILILEVI